MGLFLGIRWKNGRILVLPSQLAILLAYGPENFLLSFVPRKEVPPERELKICRRLRDFRESTKIARTVFAAECGVVGARLVNCELGVTPLSYGLFKAINRRFFVTAEWLVTGEGSVLLTRSFDEANLLERPNDRALLSEVYDTILAKNQQRHREDVEDAFNGPDGLLAQIRWLKGVLSDPNQSNKISPEAVEEILSAMRKLLASTQIDLMKHKAVNNIALDSLDSLAKRKKRHDSDA